MLHLCASCTCTPVLVYRNHELNYKVHRDECSVVKRSWVMQHHAGATSHHARLPKHILALVFEHGHARLCVCCQHGIELEQCCDEQQADKEVGLCLFYNGIHQLT